MSFKEGRGVKEGLIKVKAFPDASGFTLNKVTMQGPLERLKACLTPNTDAFTET